MQNLVVIYSDNDWHKEYPYTTPEMAAGYERFFTLARKYGFEPYRASLQWFANGSFEKGWTYKNDVWEKVDATITPTLVLDKSAFRYGDIEKMIRLTQETVIVNPWELDLLATDKLMTAAAFPQITLPTYFIQSKADLKTVVGKLDSAEVILKPRLGLGGKGIRIVHTADLLENPPSGMDIVQPMIDTSGGIPGLHDGPHDFRVIFTGSDSVLAYIRIPATGKRLANISQGATVQIVELEDIPTSVMEHVSYIQDKLAVFPFRIFSADFLFENGVPYLVELNSKPILYLTEALDAEQQMQEQYLQYLQSILQ